MPRHNSNRLFTINDIFNRSLTEAAIVQRSGGEASNREIEKAHAVAADFQSAAGGRHWAHFGAFLSQPIKTTLYLPRGVSNCLGLGRWERLSRSRKSPNREVTPTSTRPMRRV